MREYMSIRRAAFLGGIFLILDLALSPAKASPALSDELPVRFHGTYIP